MRVPSGLELMRTNLDSVFIDILINNVGMQRRAPLQDFEQAHWHVGQAVARHVIARKRGKIVNISSVQSELGRPGIAPYTASKGAVKMLTKGMAIDRPDVGLDALHRRRHRRRIRDIDNPEFSAWLIGRTPSRPWGDVEHPHPAFRGRRPPSPLTGPDRSGQMSRPTAPLPARTTTTRRCSCRASGAQQPRRDKP